MTVRFGPFFHPNFEGRRPGGGQRPPTSLSLPSSLRADLRLDCYLEYPTCRESTIHLQTSMHSLGFEPRSYGTVVSVTNHYTRQARQRHTLSEKTSYSLQMLDTSPFLSRDETYRPNDYTHQWSVTTVGKAGCKCVALWPMRGDEGRESDPPMELKGGGS
ncbi:hypothetical protein TNCV_4313031 [Trichonephila clavipes]|nr:hypothetical protein TNCV_4313031 [Trichonephila clavipes]